MANMNLYSRGDKVFVRLNMVLITVFASVDTLSFYLHRSRFI